MEYEWTDQRVLELIAEIKELPCLWDPKDPNRKSKIKKNDCYVYLAMKFGTTAEIVKVKFANLLQSYRAYKRKERKIKLKGDTYKPIWFAYIYINEFMADVYTPQGYTDTTIEEEDDDDEEEEIEEKKPNNIECEVQIMDSELNSTEKVFITTTKNPKKKKNEDTRMEEIYSYMRKKRERYEESDECTIFGQLVTTKLRKLDEMTRQFVMNDINNLMFRAAIRNTTYFNEYSQIPAHSSTAPSNSRYSSGTFPVPPHLS